MRVTEILDRFLEAGRDAPLSGLLYDLVDAIPEGSRKRARIASLVDESRADWQLLLGCDRGHLLLLSGGRSARVMALARHWKSVTAAVSTPADARALRRIAGDLDLDNVAGVVLDSCRRLPFPDASFDAVCWSEWHDVEDDDGPTPARDLLPPLIAETRRVLRPEGQVYLGLRNRCPLQTRPGRTVTPGVMPDTAIRWLAHADLALHGLYARERSGEDERETVSLRDAGSVRTHLAHCRGRRRHLPHWLYRLTVPEFAVVAGRDARRPSRLDGLLAAARDCVGALGDDWSVSSPKVNHKGKLTVALTHKGHLRWLMKIPLQPATAAGQKNGHAIQTALLRDLSPDDPLRSLLPARLEFFDHEGMTVYLEAGCPGRPWSEFGPRTPTVADSGLAGILRRLLDIAPPACGLPEPPDTLDRKIKRLSGILVLRAPELAGVYSALTDRLVEASLGRPARLRKGDFTLSNVFVADGRITGLIDWDDSEVSRLPLATFADFIFSWLWQRQGQGRSRSLALLVGNRLEELPAELGVQATLERFEASPADLATAALASWLDHADQELIHPVFRYTPERVEALLLNPCRVLSSMGLPD